MYTHVCLLGWTTESAFKLVAHPAELAKPLWMAVPLSLAVLLSLAHGIYARETREYEIN